MGKVKESKGWDKSREVKGGICQGLDKSMVGKVKVVNSQECEQSKVGKVKGR